LTDNASQYLRLTSGRLLAKNTLWNLLGAGAPLLVAIFAIPKLISGMGTDRFGVLTLAWVVIGYFSLFDLGLGRALTKIASDKLGEDRAEEIPAIAWVALTLMLIMGGAASLILGFFSPWLVQDILKVPDELKKETVKAFYWLAASIPIVISTAGLRGLLEAYQRFGLLNAIRIPMGVFNFLAPLLVLPFSRSLYPVVVILLAGRLIGWFIHLLLCFQLIPALRHPKISFRRSTVAPLLEFGGWMTVTNIIGPMMVYFDRFLISAVLSVTAVAYYSTPYEMVSKLWICPGALMAVLFPAFATSLAQDRAHTARLFGQGVNYIFLILFPLSLLIVTLAPEGLTLWLGADFASHSSFVLRWLSVGLLINSLAFVPFGLVQGVGRPDLTAKLHMVELIFYLPALWWLIKIFGINGAAIAWVARAVVDTVWLFWLAAKLIPETSPYIRRNVVIMIIAIIIMIVAGLVSGQAVKIALLSFLLLIFIGFSCFTIFMKESITDT
jgi:O-antigen/teichoic acid export membrane protein